MRADFNQCQSSFAIKNKDKIATTSLLKVVQK